MVKSIIRFSINNKLLIFIASILISIAGVYVATDIDTDELQRRSEQLQQSRVQRLNDIESAPLSTQQALNIYQETNQAGEAFEFGELVGVDLFV